jgi:K+-sensing histidine kinase KdpD
MTFGSLSLQPGNPGGVKAYVLAFVTTLLVGALTFPFHEEIGNANVIMLFLLEVFLCALWLGQKPSLLAALLAVFLFDFFFVPPQYALLTNSLKYIVMLVVMLLIALLTGQMAARLLAQNRELQASEERTRALYRMARELAGAGNPQQVDEIAAHYPANSATGSLLEIARQRLHYAELAQASHVQVEAERLRASILSSLSHDLRTPLTALVGLTETLNVRGGQLPPLVQRDMLEAVHEQAVRLADMVTKLLDLARLSAGKLSMNKEWQSLEDVTGSAVSLLKSLLLQRRQQVQVVIPPDFPLLAFDSVLMERVIGNLLENAAKFSPVDTTIHINARIVENHAEVCIADHGPGFPRHILSMADNAVAGERVGKPPVTGLGLAICAGILKAHQGHLRLDSGEGGGACACFTLPLGIPPLMEDEPEEESLLYE